MLGPIDYLAVGFEGNNFNGSILDALADAVDSGAVRVLDLVFVMKDDEGNVLTAEMDDQDEELRHIAETLGIGDNMALLSEDDLMKIGSELDVNTSAGLLIIEHLWAKDLRKALKDQNAIILDQGSIPVDVIESAVKELDEHKVAH